ncbi:MAG: protein rep [Synechococcaceae cyanobacterium SM2_3_2]|nr:protein rep [Synechococcaceae cyanobacterium SM2_3_2]
MSVNTCADRSTFRLVVATNNTLRLLKYLIYISEYESDRFHKVNKEIRACRNNYIKHGRSNCGNSFCLLCQSKKLNHLRAKLNSTLLTYLTKDPIESKSIISVTLTVKSCEPKDIRSTLDQLNQAIVTLCRRKSFPVTGYFRNNELTFNKNPKSDFYGLCHPHSHTLLAVDTSDPKARSFWSKDQTLYLRQEFQKLLNLDYLPDIDYKTVLTGNDVGYLLTRMDMTGCKSLEQYKKHLTKDPNGYYSSPITRESDTFATASYLTKQSTKALWIPESGFVKDIHADIMYNLLTTLDHLQLHSSSGSLELPTNKQVKTIKDFI